MSKGLYDLLVWRHKQNWPRARPIDYEYYVQLMHMKCAYCGTPSTYVATDPPGPTFGITRVVSERGYTKTNSVPCCAMCEQIKGDMPEAEFLHRMRRIAENHNRKKAH